MLRTKSFSLVRKDSGATDTESTARSRNRALGGSRRRRRRCSRAVDARPRIDADEERDRRVAVGGLLDLQSVERWHRRREVLFTRVCGR